MENLILLFATGIYSGYAPIAPGTAGSVVGLILGYLVCAPIWNRSPIGFVAGFAVVFAASCWIAGRAEEIFQQRDSPRIVLDEVLGMIATMYLNPFGWPWLVAGFVLFRLFDIIKPFPAGLIDARLEGGSAVMLDDLAAGVYANLAVRILARLL